LSITTEVKRCVFISYSHDDAVHAQKLYDHLAEFRALHSRESVFFDRERINAGERWSEAINQAIREADLFVLLISSNFLKSDYCVEMEAGPALSRKLNGTAEVFLILVSECNYQHMAPKAVQGQISFEDSQFAGPWGDDNRLKAVVKWRHRDSAWTQIVSRIYRHYGISTASSELSAGAALATDRETRERLASLLYLCDRSAQCDALDSRLNRAPLLNRPILIVTHGANEDRPMHLVSRLALRNIPDFLRTHSILVKPLLESGTLPLQALDRDADAPLAYAQRFFKKAGWSGQSIADVGQLLAKDPRPKIFYAILMTDDPVEAEAYRRQLAIFLSTLPDMPSDRPLVVLLIFKRRNDVAAAFSTMSVNTGSIDAAFDCCYLPQLGPVRKREIDAWLNEWDEAIAAVAPDLASLQGDLFNRFEIRPEQDGLPMADVISVVESHAGVRTNII